MQIPVRLGENVTDGIANPVRPWEIPSGLEVRSSAFRRCREQKNVTDGIANPVRLDDIKDECHIMSLKSKFMLILFVIFVLFTAADIATDRFVIFPKFVYLQHDEALKNLERSVRAIKREIYHLDSLCHDWSAWDKTFSFVENLSDDYIESNLLLSTFTDNNINLIYICNQAGKVTWGGIHDLETGEPLQLTGFSEDALPEKHPLIFQGVENRPLADLSVSGIFMTDHGLMMISSRPILTSNNEGPVRGTFIMGRFLNNKVVKTLAEQTRTDFQIFPIQSDSMPEAIKDIPSLVTDDVPYIIREQGDDRLLIFTTFPDIRGEAAFLIQMKNSKKIWAIGDTALNYAFISVLAAGLCVVIFVLLLIHRAILIPIAHLTRHALSVRETGDLSARLSMSRRDEIGTLAAEFDGMLATLEDRTTELAEVNEKLKHDIIDRKQAEESLRESEKYYRSLLYSMRDEIIIVDRNHKITDVNKKFLTIASAGRDEVIGKYCFKIFQDFRELFDRRGEHRRLREVFITGKPYKCRYAYQTSDEPNLWTDILMSPLASGNGEVTRVIIAMRDVTKEVQLEKQLRQTQKMEAIGTLAGGIAHDFNNILMSIMINTEFALKKSQGNATVCESLYLSLKAGYRAGDLVDQILTFSRESEKERIPLAVSPIVRESMKMLRASLPTTIEICQHLEAESDTVLATPAQIHQILFNLCSNAGYAMQNGGILTVILVEDIFDSDAGLMYPDITPGPYLRLTVKDTGQGISPRVIDRIFDPFFTTKGSGEGTGMGLAVVHGILSEMGGQSRSGVNRETGLFLMCFCPGLRMKGHYHPNCPLRLWTASGGFSWLMMRNFWLTP